MPQSRRRNQRKFPVKAATLENREREKKGAGKDRRRYFNAEVNGAERESAREEETQANRVICGASSTRRPCRVVTCRFPARDDTPQREIVSFDIYVRACTCTGRVYVFAHAPCFHHFYNFFDNFSNKNQPVIPIFNGCQRFEIKALTGKMERHCAKRLLITRRIDIAAIFRFLAETWQRRARPETR